MSGEVKKPAGRDVFVIPSLPDTPADIVVLGEGPVVIQTRYALDEAVLRSLEQSPVELLQQDLGVIRKRITDDPGGEGLQEAMDSYWARVEAMTLSHILLVESRIWAKLMEEGDSPALQKVALRAYYRIIQHEHFEMRPSELYRSGNALFAEIEHGDLNASHEALAIYHGFVERYYSKRPDFALLEASGFRATAQRKIHGVFYRGRDGNVDADMITHLNNLLAIYAQIIFLDGIDLLEINYGIEWVESYMHEGHPLQRRAKEVRTSLDMTRDLLEGKTDPPAPGTLTQGVVEGNELPLTAGVIDTAKYDARMIGSPLMEVPTSETQTVILHGSLTMTGSKIKPV